jgi:hypothetical protein
MLSESYFGLHKKEKALKTIELAIKYSDFDKNNKEFKEFIVTTN